MSLPISILLIASAAAAGAIEPPPPKLTEQWTPVPPVVSAPEHKPPSDAVILFDGRTLDSWTAARGGPPGWKIAHGALVVVPKSGSLHTKAAFGDVQLHLEWRTPHTLTGSGQERGNSGIYFMERYELQILDSFNNSTYVNGQAGSIYKQSSPLVNASRAPGEWQSYDVIFIAPRFSATGALESKAHMTVLHNGVLVQHDVVLQGPTTYRGLPRYEPHAARLPLLLQDHGNPVAFRNIWLRDLSTPDSAAPDVATEKPPPSPPMVLNPDDRIRVQRSFAAVAEEERLYTISVGTPAGVHYTYDLENASILRVWRGAFLDVTDLWRDRGWTQLAKPAAPAIDLHPDPLLANLVYRRRKPDSLTEHWPTHAGLTAQSRGYRLEKNGQPVFLYEFAGRVLEDHIAPLTDEKGAAAGLTRRLHFTGMPWDGTMWLLLATATNIESRPGGTYLIGDRGIRIEWPPSAALQPQKHADGERQLLLVHLPQDSAPFDLEYSLLW